MLKWLKTRRYLRRLARVGKEVDALTHRLRTSTSREAVAALEALAHFGDPRAIEPVVEALRHPGSQVREAAAVALEHLAGCVDVDALLSMLGAAHYRARIIAVKALGDRGDRRAADALIEVLGDPNSAVRRGAAEALAALGEPQWRQYVRGALDDMKRLSELGDPRATGPLLAALAKGAPDLVRAAAAGLGKLGDARCLGPLVARLDDSATEVREAAAAALGELGDGRAVEPLICALADAQPDVRRAAAAALGELGDRRAVGPLVGALVDDAPEFRRGAAEALAALGEPQWRECVRGDPDDVKRLGELGDPRATGPLLAALAKGAPDVVRIAAAGLGKLGDGRCLGPLAARLEHSATEVREAAAAALGELGDGRAVEPLICALADAQPDVRRAAAAALAQLGEPAWQRWACGDADDFDRLGRSGDHRATQPLIRALDEPFGNLRQAAALALGRLGDRQATAPLLRALRDRESQVRSAAAEALADLGDSCALAALVESLKDSEPAVREAAAGAVDRLGGVDRLANDLTARDESTRRAAADALGALGALGIPRAAGPLTGCLLDASATVRIVAARALAKLGQTKWLQWVKGDEEDFLRLGGSGERVAVDALSIALEAASPLVAEAAAAAIGTLADQRAVVPLVKALQRRERPIREAAAWALIGIAQHHPWVIGTRWQQVAGLIHALHTDIAHSDIDDRRWGSRHDDIPHVDKLHGHADEHWHQSCYLPEHIDQDGHTDRPPGHSDYHSDRAIPKVVGGAHHDKAHEDVGPHLPPQPPAMASATAEMLSIVCPNPRCGKRLRVAAKHAGRRAKCPSCGHLVTVPPRAAGMDDPPVVDF